MTEQQPLDAATLHSLSHYFRTLNPDTPWDRYNKDYCKRNASYLIAEIHRLQAELARLRTGDAERHEAGLSSLHSISYRMDGLTSEEVEIIVSDAIKEARQGGAE